MIPNFLHSRGETRQRDVEYRADMKAAGVGALRAQSTPVFPLGAKNNMKVKKTLEFGRDYQGKPQRGWPFSNSPGCNAGLKIH